MINLKGNLRLYTKAIIHYFNTNSYIYICCGIMQARVHTNLRLEAMEVEITDYKE